MHESVQDKKIHNIRNFLTVIRINLERLKKKCQKEKKNEYVVYLEKVDSQVDNIVKELEG